MSGAQWSPERLQELADEMERSTYEACDWTEAHAALRAFARVVEDALALRQGYKEWTNYRMSNSDFAEHVDAVLADALDAGRDE